MRQPTEKLLPVPRQGGSIHSENPSQTRHFRVLVKKVYHRVENFHRLLMRACPKFDQRLPRLPQPTHQIRTNALPTMIFKV